MSVSVAVPVRLVIYGVGQYGCYIARFALEKGWVIVAAFNRAGDKVGKDLGRLAGLDRDLGVIVQDCDSVDYAALQADIGIVTLTNQLATNFIAHQRLLSAGINVLCHGAESYYPYGCDADIARKIDDLAKRHQVTFTGGGIWDMSRIWSGILLLGPCTQITSLYHSSITDVHGQAATVAQAREVGIGLTVEEFYSRGLDHAPLARSYNTIAEHVLSATGYTVTSSTIKISPVVYAEAISNPWTGESIPAGLCLGTRIVGHIETAQGVAATVEIELRVFKPGETEHVFWSVDGSPRNELRVNRKDTAYNTAGSLFNRIPDVIKAPPGIVLVSQMGPLNHSATI